MMVPLAKNHFIRSTAFYQMTKTSKNAGDIIEATKP